MAKSALCVINPAAGKGGLERWRAFAGSLKRLGFVFDEVFASQPGHALTLAHRESASHDLIVAVGGDGTVFEVVNGILSAPGTHPALAIVPFGTGNDSARAVGTGNEANALKALTSRSERAIDVIEIQCRSGDRSVTRYAMLFASVGISADLLRQTTPRLKSVLGQRMAYLAGLLLALRVHASGGMRIDCDGHVVEGRYILVCASNGETFGGGIRIAPGARIDDGEFNVNLIAGVGRIEALKHLRRVYQGRHITHPKVDYRTARALAIETDQIADVAADGDLIGQTPAKFMIRPRALTVLTPASW